MGEVETLIPVNGENGAQHVDDDEQPSSIRIPPTTSDRMANAAVRVGAGTFMLWNPATAAPKFISLGRPWYRRTAARARRSTRSATSRLSGT